MAVLALPRRVDWPTEAAMSKLRVETEAEWLATGDPVAMLRAAFDRKVAVRKLRLLAVAWFGLLADQYTDDRLRLLARAVERHADGLLTAAEFEAALGFVGWVFGECRQGRSVRARGNLAGLFCGLFLEPSRRVADASAFLGADGIGEPARAAMCRQARCIFGNPWRPLLPCTFPAHVLGLAQSIYAAFPAVSEDYAILGDALEELGEAEAAAHCRLESHAKGCFVVDWVLRKW
jgi:hypothetical protein